MVKDDRRQTARSAPADNPNRPSAKSPRRVRKLLVIVLVTTVALIVTGPLIVARSGLRQKIAPLRKRSSSSPMERSSSSPMKQPCTTGGPWRNWALVTSRVTVAPAARCWSASAIPLYRKPRDR